jgi:2-haloacid dehalogenase
MHSAALDTVVFDLGNVLIDWSPRHLYRKLFGADIEGMERFLAEVCNGAWNERQDAGRTWEEGIQEAVARYPEQADLIRAFRHRWDEMLGGPMHDSVAVLEELRKNGTRLLALTNWSRETFPIALERYEFLSWFEGILVSGQEGIIKPDPAIYRLLISRFAVDVSRAVFIDDSLRNVEGARLVGLHALHFGGAAKLRSDLIALGLPLVQAGATAVA